MKLLVEIPNHHYENIKDLDSVSLGRMPYKGIIMHSINVIRNGQVLPENGQRADKGGEMELQGKFKYTLEDFKAQVKASTLKVGDRLITEDIAGKAVFEVAEIRKKYIYMVRRYCLPDKYDQTHDDLMDFLNNEYLDTLPQDLKSIMGKREGSRIFVPWFNEVFGEREDCSWADKSKGKQWSLFRKGYGRIRLDGDKHGCSRWYWLASPYVSDSSDFCLVGTSGAPNSLYAGASLGVLPCFKINRKAIAE